jgi:hypothetical protein
MAGHEFRGRHLEAFPGPVINHRLKQNDDRRTCSLLRLCKLATPAGDGGYTDTELMDN